MATTKTETAPADANTASTKPSIPWLAKIHPYFEDAEHVLVLKLDILLLTWAFIAGLMKDMDQSATTAAYVSGMQEALSLYGNELVEFTTYFSIGYALFIVPSQLIQTRVRPSLWLPFCEVVWGAITLATFAAKNARTVFVLRFFLGVFEATSWPGIVNLIFNWYTPRELGKRLAIFGVSSQAGSMFLGILQAALYKNLNGAHGLEGWQWLFVVSGIMTIVWGLYGFIAIPDAPTTTRALWLTQDERALAASRMAKSGTTTQEIVKGKALWSRVRKLFTSPITYLFLAAYLQFAWSQRANSYFLLYLKGLKTGDGTALYSVYTVNLIPLGGYAISIVANISLNALSDWKDWRWQIAVGAALLQVIATSVLAAWPGGRGTIMTFYFLTFATAAWGYALLAWLAIILRKEPEARSVIVGLAVTLVYVGHATIPLRAWRTADSPRYPIGFPLAAAFSVGSIAAILGMLWYVRKYPDILDFGLNWKTLREAGDSVADLDKVEVDSQDGDQGQKGPAKETTKTVF
ncbi:vitamin H transporter [Colletotrichum tofieldiae]|uniref:Vitamin H transporter n=1 Tax=Colletotrichum tofieldiae TaxID=708197 RepID=A0A166ZDN3_9PEZI|nr:vitamin H transporter [Colletotrichum tofieldiae]GKT55880.1 vitamin H transporter [Colletotrichum tofieldiae]GKT79284.1 vitamin H transporter [Colletotrichum tofieldiae]GKT82451.1 vitamin H transporter [Colletotrichum tofieldiae]